ncbi:MAG: glycosyltransferase [Candidatus Berkiella sp.]
MKILIVHNAYQSQFIGGEDIVVKREVAALKAMLGDANVFEYAVSNDDIKLGKLFKNIWGDTSHFAAVKTLVENQKINLVHVHNFFPLLTPSVFAAAKSAGAKVVHTLHNFRWWCLNGTLYREGKGICDECVGKPLALAGIRHRCYRNSLAQSTASAAAFAWYRFKEYQRYIDAYFTLSHFQNEKLRPLLGAEKLFYKPNSIEPVKAQLPLTDKNGYLFVGRLEAAKGIELLLETWLKLPLTYELTVIGKGVDEPSLRERYRQSNITFLGQLPHEQTLSYIAKAKYLVHTSKAFETFGLTMIEAMARQTPVIGLNLGTRKEMIEHGKNGFLCEESGLVNTILLSQEYANYEQMAKAAQNFASQFYTEPVMSQQVNLYQQLLQEKIYVS